MLPISLILAYTEWMDKRAENVQPEPVGYCAIVMPEIDHFQAYFIIDIDEVRRGVLSMKMTAMAAMGPEGSFGAIQATFAEAALTGNEVVVASAALALQTMSHHTYFYVVANKDPQGTRTQLFELEAGSIVEARDLINNLPEVLAIKERLLSQVATRMMSSAFH